jgi:hypothetical protein
MLHSDVAASNSAIDIFPETSEKYNAQSMDTCLGPRKRVNIMLDKNPGISDTTFWE